VTRVALCGEALEDAARVLGLEVVADAPQIVLVDLRDPAGVARAAALPAELPRVAVAGAEHELILRAVAARVPLARTADPAELGPLVAAAIPPNAPRGARVLLVTGTAGGCGRTLLVSNVALRLAAAAKVLVLDATGAGTAAWWMGLPAGPWAEIEGLVDELSAEHLAVVAAERGSLRVVGGGPLAPSLALLMAAARVAPALADLVIVDAPPLHDERTRALLGVADRVLIVLGDEPVAAGGLDGAVDERAWIIGSRTRSDRIAGRPVLRSIPDDPGAVRSAARGPAAAGGALGRAYDELAELIAIDAS